MTLRLFSLLLIVATVAASSQSNTVGVLEHDTARAYPGYTLFAPIASTTTYLIDNDGQVVQTWPSKYRPGQAVMLLDDGTLLRTASPSGNAPLNGGGSGGIVERIAWDGTVLWTYQHYSAAARAHHDVEILPNGNILLIVWYPVPRDTAYALGRRPQKLVDQTMWFERIIEVRPTGANGGEIVWTWDSRDHLIQNESEAKPNFGVVSEHPERIDINAGGTRTDWLHFNSVRYNAARDEVMVSVHNLSELWVIKKSTGQLVYRWGNPQIYGRGAPGSQSLFAQHDARWIPDGLQGAGNILIFNNGIGRAGGPYSSLDEITPPLDEGGDYVLGQGASYGPAGTTWRYAPSQGQTFYATNVSGSTRQPNGNTLACLGPQGTFVEVTTDGDVVWRYVSPVSMNGVVRQGQIPQNNMIFKIYRYGKEHPALLGRALTPRGRLEDGPLGVQLPVKHDGLQWMYMPGSGMARVTSEADVTVRLDAYDVVGRWLGAVVDGTITAGEHIVSVPSGTMLIYRSW